MVNTDEGEIFYISKGLSWQGWLFLWTFWGLPIIWFVDFILSFFDPDINYSWSLETILWSSVFMTLFIIGLNLFLLKFYVAKDGLLVRRWFRFTFIRWKETNYIHHEPTRSAMWPIAHWWIALNIDGTVVREYSIFLFLFRDSKQLARQIVYAAQSDNPQIYIDLSTITELPVN